MAITPANEFQPGKRLTDGDEINSQLVTPINALITLVEGSPADIISANVIFTVDAGVSAGAGGTQAKATQMEGQIATITTCASDNDSVMLPAGVEGAVFSCWNNTAKSAQVFGNGTDTINGVATATGVAQAAGSKALYFCTSDQPAASWFRILSA